MNIGPFAFPAGVIALFVGVVIALFVARATDKGRRDADSTVFWSLLVGLVVARVSFVLHYLPAYQGSLLKIVDFRDQGFDLVPGLVAGVIWGLWRIVRKRESRRAMALSMIMGLIAWGAATAGLDTSARQGTVPTVSLSGLDGVQRPLVQSDGKPLVVNLWATWCPPCRREMPALAKAQHDYPGVDIAFVNQGEPRDDVDAFLRWAQLTPQNVLLDPTLSVSRAVDANAYPTTLFYDAHGKLLQVHLGAFSEATLAHTIESLYPKVEKVAADARAADVMRVAVRSDR